MPPKPWYSKGLRFECSGCGNCCTNRGDYAFVNLTEEEVERIAAFLDLSRRAFLTRYCEGQAGFAPTLMTGSEACTFLDEDKRCSIYPVRPLQCSTWPFWKENLERGTWEGEVRRECPGTGLGPLFPVEEIERIAQSLEDAFE